MDDDPIGYRRVDDGTETGKGPAGVSGPIEVRPRAGVQDSADRQDPEELSWGALAHHNNTLKYRNARVVPTDIYAEAGYEQRLFQATNMYHGQVDRSLLFATTLLCWTRRTARC
jgi:hypothetical protein